MQRINTNFFQSTKICPEEFLPPLYKTHNNQVQNIQGMMQEA